MVGRQASLRLIGLVLFAWLPVVAGWHLAGPFGGSARAIAIDPENRNPLLAGARDSLYSAQTTPGHPGGCCRFRGTTPGTFNALIIDPAFIGHFYAGLDAGDSPDSGVYESRDGGEHWFRWPAYADRASNRWPSRPAIRACWRRGPPKGVYRSADWGEKLAENFGGKQFGDAGHHRAGFRSNEPRTLYAGTPHLPWKTIDSGAHWQPIATRID